MDGECPECSRLEHEHNEATRAYVASLSKLADGKSTREDVTVAIERQYLARKALLNHTATHKASQASTY